MARKRTQFDASTDQQIAAMMAKGMPAEAISAALTAAGVKGASRPTIGRRMVEMRAGVNASIAARAKASKPPKGKPAPAPAHVEPPTPDEIATATPDKLSQWVLETKAAADAAKDEGDLSQYGGLMRVSVAIQEAIRKATPLPVHDPADDPDMRAMAAATAARLHLMADQVLGAKP